MILTFILEDMVMRREKKVSKKPRGPVKRQRRAAAAARKVRHGR